MARAADAEMRKDLVIRAGYAGVIVIAMVGWLVRIRRAPSCLTRRFREACDLKTLSLALRSSGDAGRGFGRVGAAAALVAG